MPRELPATAVAPAASNEPIAFLRVIIYCYYFLTSNVFVQTKKFCRMQNTVVQASCLYCLACTGETPVRQCASDIIFICALYYVDSEATAWMRAML